MGKLNKKPQSLKRNFIISLLAALIFLPTVGFFLWIGTWQTYTDNRGFSIRHPSFISETAFGGLVLGEKKRENILIAQSSSENLYTGSTVFFIFRYPKNAVGENGIQKLAQNAFSTREGEMDFTKKLKIGDTVLNGKTSKIVSFEAISPDNAAHTLEKQYFVEGNEYYYEINSTVYIDELPLWKRTLSTFLSKLVVNTFNFAK